MNKGEIRREKGKGEFWLGERKVGEITSNAKEKKRGEEGCLLL
jgi:hypothetical protein